MVIIGIQHYKISLLAYFDATDTVRPVPVRSSLCTPSVNTRLSKSKYCFMIADYEL